MRIFNIGDSLVLVDGTKCTIVDITHNHSLQELIYTVDVPAGNKDHTNVRTQDIMCVL